MSDEVTVSLSSGRPSNEDALFRWESAHRMSTIGEGYAWPNIAISSDGVRSFLDSQPSSSPESVLFHYFGAQGRQAVTATSLETAIDGFVADVLERLEGNEVRESNLHRLWRDLQTEREHSELARFRRLEAQLGHEPQPGQVEAWRLGERCARLIRDQEKRDRLPIDDRTLTAFAGATNSAISRQNGNPCRVSFALDGENGGSHVWLRSPRETGRRFDLARLIGDRVLRKRLNGSTEPLLPATRASTYRQKMQRAFAAELLSPFAAVDDMMGGDAASSGDLSQCAGP